MKIWLAGEYGTSGRYRDAGRVYLEAVESLRRTRGDDARETLIAMSALGWNYEQEAQAMPVSSDPNGRSSRRELLDKAESVLRPTLEKMQRLLGADNRHTLRVAHGLGLTLMVEGRHAESEALLRDTVERLTRGLGEGHVDTINTSITLGAVLYFSGRRELAEKMAHELLERSRRAVGDDGYLVLLIETKLGGLYLDQGRYDDAEPLLRDSASKAPRVLGEQNQFTREAIASLLRLESVRSRTRSERKEK